jgi:outer membrane protein OmpA-like peptidoglycan-associated protein
MKRLLSLILFLCCTGCVNEVVKTVPTLSIHVQPLDTIETTAGSSITYDIQSLTEDAPLPEALIDITPSYSNNSDRVTTDASGLADFALNIPDTLSEGLYSIKFKGQRFYYGSSSTETRHVLIKGPEAHIASVDIVARGIRPDGSIVPEPVANITSVHARSSMPLLPHLFFDVGSADIPTRYERLASTGFNLQSLAGKAADAANHHILDIVGQRLRLFPLADITLTGTNANAGAEKGNVTLSRTRAQAVRDYLVNTWGIEAGRVTVDARNLPEIPTNPVTLEGMQENRRVEFASNDSRITAPVSIEQRDTMSLGETIVRFETTFQPKDHMLKSWRITLDQNGATVGQALSGSGTPPAVQTMTIEHATALLNQPLRFRLVATDINDKVLTDEGMTRIVPPAVERSNLERFAMMYFDFDRSDVNERGRQMLELVSESISRDCKALSINGFTDFTGTEDYNQMLSEARANSAATSLRSMTTFPNDLDVVGHGERDPKFDNDLPEGRQLNRRVEFTIEKSF